MVPPALCRHFGTCGGCTLQDLSENDYRDAKRDQVGRALRRHGFSGDETGEVISVPPASRRRAGFKIQKMNDAVAVGFHAAQSHTIVDMRECLVLTPALFALVGQMRAMFAGILGDGEKADAFVTQTDTGFDVALSLRRKPSPSLTAALAPWCSRANIARITMGGEIVAGLRAPQIRLGMADVTLPPNAFLQPTRAGEAVLQDFVVRAAGKSRHVIDLFSGLGTFTFPLGARARVHGVDLDETMVNALTVAARNTQGLKPVTAEARDLFKRPVSAPELARFDCAVLDPPRAGAQAQTAQLARSKIGRVVYVSCSPETFARDARVLCEGGFAMEPVTVVDQFLWSSHTELATAFVRS